MPRLPEEEIVTETQLVNGDDRTTSPKNATVIPSLSFLNKQEEHNCMPKSIAWALHSIGKEDVAVNFLETLREAETKSNTPLLVGSQGGRGGDRGKV